MTYVWPITIHVSEQNDWPNFLILVSKTIYAKIDRPAGIVLFAAPMMRIKFWMTGRATPQFLCLLQKRKCCTVSLRLLWTYIVFVQYKWLDLLLKTFQKNPNLSHREFPGYNASNILIWLYLGLMIFNLIFLVVSLEISIRSPRSCIRLETTRWTPNY